MSVWLLRASPTRHALLQFSGARLLPLRKRSIWAEWFHLKDEWAPNGPIVPCDSLVTSVKCLSAAKIMEAFTSDGANKMTSKATIVYDPKPVAYKAVRVWLSNGRRMLGIWTGTKWWSTEGEIEPVKWELEERRKKTDKLRKAIPRD